MLTATSPLTQFMHSDSCNDEEILEKIAEGDAAAFEVFVRRHSATVQRLAAAVTQETALAEDVTQQTFLAVFRNAGSFARKGSARSWLLTIARNEAYQAKKRAPREMPVEESLLTLGIEAGWGASNPETELDEIWARKLLTRALERLSAEDQEVLVLRDVEQLTGPEAALALGISLRALKSRLHRARLRLAVQFHEVSQQNVPTGDDAVRGLSAKDPIVTAEKRQGKGHARTD